jgi:signal peptidase I
MLNKRIDKYTTDIKNSYLEIIKQVVIAILIAVIFRSFTFEPYRIPSSSMKPTLIIGDHIFVTKFSYGFSRYSLPFNINLIPGENRIFQVAKPERGDIIVFRGPKNPHVTYIKRLVGLPGDKIQVNNGVLSINGNDVKLVDDGYFLDDNNEIVKKYIETLPNGVSYNILERTPTGDLDNTEVFEVPEGNYFFMGDNRDQSGDSRKLSGIGYVPEKYLVGRADVIFFSSKAPVWTLWNLFRDIELSRSFISLSPTHGNN